MSNSKRGASGDQAEKQGYDWREQIGEKEDEDEEQDEAVLGEEGFGFVPFIGEKGEEHF